MNRKFLELIPTHILCVYCGEWHINKGVCELRLFHSLHTSKECKCIHNDYGSFHFWFSEDKMYYRTTSRCSSCGQKSLSGKISIKDIVENDDEASVTFTVPFLSNDMINNYTCRNCSSIRRCLYARLGEAGDGYHMKIKIGFKFDRRKFDAIVKEEHIRKEQEEATKKAEQEKKENERMTTAVENAKKTTLITQFFEYSPKENWELAKSWVEKYKPTLKWAVPVLCLYGAYRILKSTDSSFSVENIDTLCESENGVVLEELKDKDKLEELLLVGGLAAGAYGAIKSTSWIFADKKPQEIFVEDISTGMDELAELKDKDASLLKKAENLLPVAISVITVYLLVKKELPFGEKVNNKINLISVTLKNKLEKYGEKANSLVKDKFDIDLSSEEGKHKVRNFTLLAAIVAIVAILYGKKMLGSKYVDDEIPFGKDEEDKPMQKVINDVLNIMKKLAPALFGASISMLVATKVFKEDAAEEYEAETESEDSDEEI